MTFFQDMTNAVTAYPSDHVELEIFQVNFPGPAINTNEEGTFNVRITNRGPLIMNDVTIRIEGVNGTLVKRGTTAHHQFNSEITSGSSISRLNAHGGSDVFEQLVFKAPANASQRANDLFKVTVEAWDADLSHSLISHSRPSNLPQAVFEARVFPG